MWALWSRWMTTCRTERLPASGSHYTSPRSSPRRSKSVGKFTEYFAHCSHQIHCTGDKVTVYQPVQSIVLKWQQGNNYSVCWSKHSFTVQRMCSRYDVDFFHISLVWYSCAHMCAWMCGMMAEAGGGERASEQSCLICAWGEKYPRVQCVMESRQKWGDLWEPNLKHCHDGSWKRVKVGGSVIFKDEPRGEADRKQGQIWPRKNGRRRKERRRRMQSYFHLDISLPLLLF